MKTNNILPTLIASLLFLGLATSCKGFLDHRPYSVGETSGDYWSNPNNLYSAVDALNRFTSEEGITGRGIMWLENCSDNLVTGRPQGEAQIIKNFEMTGNTGRDQNENWGTMYGIIAQANDIIRNVKGRNDIDPKMQEFALGNAYFYRALSYLWLAPWYGDNSINGGIPNITDETKLTEYDQPRPKSVLVNYDQILSDFDKAAEFLPLFSQQSEDDYGRPWKASAWGLAARAALYASQFDSSYLDKVIMYCDKIMGLNGVDKRDLYPDFENLFTVKNNFSSEYIFSFLGSPTTQAGPKFHGMSFQNKGWGAFNFWGYFQPTLELWNAFEEGDIRRKVSIARPGDVVRFFDTDVQLCVNPVDMSSESGLTFIKWISPYRSAKNAGVEFLPDGNFMSTTLGMIVVRYADILLMKAEALIWKNGEGDATAKSLLNQIRTRAGLPANSKATKAELKNERRCELAFEFCTPRFLDVVRWKDYSLLEQPLHGYDRGYYTEHREYKVITVWPARKFNPNKNHVFAIPAKDIAKHKNLKQNAGY